MVIMAHSKGDRNGSLVDWDSPVVKDQMRTGLGRGEVGRDGHYALETPVCTYTHVCEYRQTAHGDTS